MFLSIGMLKQKYFLTDIFILSAEKQPIKLSWRKIEWLICDVPLSVKHTRVVLFNRVSSLMFSFLSCIILFNLLIFN